MTWLIRSLIESAAMFWEVLWALVLGFSVSALLQVFISKEQMTKTLGKTALRSVALATAFGAASSSCSYAAVAAAKTAFKKGAALVPTLAFMFASTNLVFELGFVLWLLLGWRFVLAEFIGAFVLIGVMWTIVSLTLPKGLEDEARSHSEAHESGHDHGSGTGNRLTQVANAFVMDWAMLWRDMLVGFLISGFLSVLVPNRVWHALFLTHSAPPLLRLIENVFVGPLIAVLSFVCSVGNIPLASILWSGGISFGGVTAFIYADLIIVPLILAYRRFYGGRAALYITVVMFASMVIAGLVVDLLFESLHLVPTGARPPSAVSRAQFSWDYTTYLDFAAIALSGFFAFVYVRGKTMSHGAHHH